MVDVFTAPQGLSFHERLVLNTPALLDLKAEYDWTDEDEDDGEMEPLTHNKTEAPHLVAGLSSGVITQRLFNFRSFALF